MSAIPSAQQQAIASQYGTQTKPIDEDMGLGHRVFRQAQMAAPVPLASPTPAGAGSLFVVDTITVRDRPITIQGVVSVAALTHVSLYGRTGENAPWTLLAADGDFASPTTVPNDCILAASNSLSTTASGSNFILTLSWPGIYQYQLQASGVTGAMVQLFYGVGAES